MPPHPLQHESLTESLDEPAILLNHVEDMPTADVEKIHLADNYLDKYRFLALQRYHPIQTNIYP